VIAVTGKKLVVSSASERGNGNFGQTY